MNRKKQKIVFLIILVLAFGIWKQTGADASEISTESIESTEGTIVEETESITEENQITAEQETKLQEDASTETIPEQKIEEASEMEDGAADLKEDDTDKIPEDISVLLDENGQSLSVAYYNGISCYMNLYLYEYQIQYMKKYADYLEKKTEAYELLYDLGEVTQTDVKACQAEAVSCNAEVTVLKNEKEYCSVYMAEKGMDFSGLHLEEKKTIHDSGYYREHYPERDYVQIVRYVTDFNNAIAYIEAKEVEIESIEMNINKKKLLYQEGEIMELELLEEEVLLEKARYELAKYYVDMNRAYYNLETA